MIHPVDCSGIRVREQELRHLCHQRRGNRNPGVGVAWLPDGWSLTAGLAPVWELAAQASGWILGVSLAWPLPPLTLLVRLGELVGLVLGLGWALELVRERNLLRRRKGGERCRSRSQGRGLEVEQCSSLTRHGLEMGELRCCLLKFLHRDSL